MNILARYFMAVAIVASVNGVALLSVSQAADIIYWADYGPSTHNSTQDGKIHTITSLGEQYSFIQSSDLSGDVTTLINPYDVAVDNRGDPSNWKIYWTDSVGGTDGRIVRADMDGSNTELLVSGLTGVRGLDLDLASGKMYYVIVDDVRSANLDGSGDVSLLTPTVLADLDPDPQGTGYIEFVPKVFGLIDVAITTDASEIAGRLHHSGVNIETGATYDDDDFVGVSGDLLNGGVAYDKASNNYVLPFWDGSDTIFFGDDFGDAGQYFASGITSAGVLWDVALIEGAGGNTAYATVNIGTGTADQIVSIDGIGQTTSVLYTGSTLDSHFAGITVINPELPPGMLGALSMMLSFLLIRFRQRF